MRPGRVSKRTRARGAGLVALVSWCGSSACAGDHGPSEAVAANGAATTTASGTEGTVSSIGASTTGSVPSTDGTLTSAAPGTATGDSGTGSVSASSGNSGTTGGASTSGSTDGATTLAATHGVGGASSSSSSGSGSGSGSSMTGPETTGAGGSSATGEFQLRWVDEFDTVDTSRWQPMTHSWDGNLAQFSAETISVSDGVLSLSLTRAPEGSDKPYLGAEYRSLDTLTYGKIEARVRFARGSAVVSSLVLIFTPWPPDDWNELDIECLGTGQTQFNHMVNIPPADPITGHVQYPSIVELGFDPAADFHEYAIEWVPGEARFVVDGVLRHTATEEMSRMTLPQNILLTIWASDAAAWAGPVDETTAPTTAQYDWMRVYDYVGP